MTHVRTSPYYPQSNGKLERYYKTIKGDAIRPARSSIDDARAVVTRFAQRGRLHAGRESVLGLVVSSNLELSRHGRS